MSTIIIVIFTIVPLVSWVYANAARALKTPIHAVLVTINGWFATAEMDITVQIVMKRVSDRFSCIIMKNQFDFLFNIQMHGDIIFKLFIKSNCINSDFMR